jgi:DNA-binding transcriptional ArsR family regulator
LTVTSSTPLFGEWSHNYHPLDELCSKLDELRATTRTAGKLHFKEITGTSDSKLSYHLRILESERMICAKRVKSWRVYSITRRGRASLDLSNP